MLIIINKLTFIFVLFELQLHKTQQLTTKPTGGTAPLLGAQPHVLPLWLRP